MSLCAPHSIGQLFTVVHLIFLVFAETSQSFYLKKSGYAVGREEDMRKLDLHLYSTAISVHLLPLLI